jgi:hypothetical protein
VSAGYHTQLIVIAKDGSSRLVAISASDSADTIGNDVIAAIQGERLFQLAPCDRSTVFETLLVEARQHLDGLRKDERAATIQASVLSDELDAERAAHAETKSRFALAEAELRGENEPDADGESDP